MVKKLDLRPSLPRLIGGLQRQSTQGIARPTSRLVVQEPHEAPDGVSVIPSRDVVQELTDARDGLDAAEDRIEAAEEALDEARGDFDGRMDVLDTALTTAQGEIEQAKTDLGLIEVDLAPGGGTYDRITDALLQAGDAQDAADTAQGTATAAQTAASNAQDTADQAVTAAGNAQTAASNAATAASTAQDAADQAAQDAATAAGIAASKGDVLIQETAPATEMRKDTTLWIDTTGGTNTPKRWNGSAWVAVTDKAAVDAAAAAATAQSTANAAQDAADQAASAAADAQDTADQAVLDAAAAQAAAGNAQDTADAAQTAAAGKSAIYYSTEAPSGTGTRQGDVWFRRDSQGSTIGMWEWTGASWQSRTLRDEVIANLDAGKITTGYLAADRLNARSITAEKLVLGSSENLIPNGSGEFGDLGGWAMFTNMTGVLWETDDAPLGIPGYVRFDKTGSKTATGVGGLFDVEPGAEYLFEAYIRADVAGSRLYVEPRDDEGGVASDNFAIPGYPSGSGDGTGNLGRYLIQNRDVPTTWTRIVGRTVIKPGVHKMRIGAVFVNHPNGTVTDAVVDIAGLRLQKRASAELIVDGAITADKVAANAVTAGKIAAGAVTTEKLLAGAVTAEKMVAIDSLMQNLTATGVANINVTVANELYAKMAVVDKLQALSGIITTDMIATGAVTASKVEVTEELTAAIAAILELSAEQVVIGRDARFWDGGLEFYAPPADGQDPNDWDNRIPLISLTPNGDVSISVAQDGEATAGLSADGGVWGHSGAFEELYVGGDSVIDIVDGKTDGITGVALLDGEVNVYTTRRDVLGIRTEMTSGRMYRVDWHAGISVGTGAFRAYVNTSEAAQTDVYRVLNTVTESGGVTHGSLMIPKWTEGETRDVQVKLEAHTDAGTSIVRTDAWLAVEDMGNAVVPEIVTATNPTPPTQVYTRTFTSQPGVPTRPNGSFAPDGRRMVGGQSSGWGSDMSEHVFYQFSLGALAGSTILSARLSFTVSSTMYGGVPLALRIDATTGYLNGRVNVFNGAFNVGGRSATISSALRHNIIGKAGFLFSPLYPGTNQGYGGMGERMTLVVKYRK